MWLIRAYMRDLTEFFAGDDGRFSRMVEREGKSLATAHPAGWTQHIVNCTSEEAIAFHRSELAEIYTQLINWKMLAEMPANMKGLNK